MLLCLVDSTGASYRHHWFNLDPKETSMLDVLTIMAQTFHWPIYWPERFTGHSNEAFPQRHHFSGRRPPMPPMRKPEAVASFRPNFRGDRILGGSEVVLPPSKSDEMVSPMTL